MNTGKLALQPASVWNLESNALEFTCYGSHLAKPVSLEAPLERVARIVPRRAG